MSSYKHTDETAILNALKEISDPEQLGNIVEHQRITGLVVKNGEVSFAISLPAAIAQKSETLRKSAEMLVKNLPGIHSVKAILTAHRPAPASPSVPPSRQMKTSVPGVRHIIAVASGKGGVGKSTSAVNLALGLQSLGLKIGLLDADIYGPSQPRLLGLTGKPSSLDGKTLQPMLGFGLKVMSMGFLIPEDTPMIWRGPMVMSAINQLLRDVAWGDLDVLVADLPPGTGDAQLTMAQQVPLSGAVIVSTPQDIALIDAKKGMNMFRKVEVPLLGIIENMSYFSCPHCGKRSDIFAHGGARDEAIKNNVPFLGEIPLALDIRQTSDEGRPIVQSQPQSPYAIAYIEIAKKVWEGLQQQQRMAPSIVVEN